MAWQWQSPGDARPWLSQSLASSTVYTEDDPSGACDTTKNPSPHGQSVAGYTLMGLEGVLFEIKTSPPCVGEENATCLGFGAIFQS